MDLNDIGMFDLGLIVHSPMGMISFAMSVYFRWIIVEFGACFSSRSKLPLAAKSAMKFP